MLSLDMYKKIVSQIGEYLMYMILYFQGEPYLNPSFFDIVKDAKKRRIYTTTSTNAHFLTDENCKKTIDSGLDRIIISLGWNRAGDLFFIQDWWTIPACD